MNVVEDVFEYLQNAVVSGKWKLNEKIPSEKQLCETLNVSRASVRAAINRLIGIGVLESRQGGGTYVCKYNIIDSMNLFSPFFKVDQVDRISMFEFRRIIETESAALAAMRATADMVDEMYRANTKMEQADNLEEVAKFDWEFHLLISKATANPAIIKVMELFSGILISMFNDNVRTLDKKGVDYHKLIINAIETRNPEMAKKYMLEHIQTTATAFI